MPVRVRLPICSSPFFIVSRWLRWSNMWRVYQLTVLSTHTLLAFFRPSEVGIDTGAKYQVVSLIALSSSMLDSRVSLPFCCLEGLVNVYKAWKSYGDAASYTSLLLDEVAICGLSCVLVVVIERLAKLHIESRLESGDYSCRLTGFRSVLRGVSDGDILAWCQQDFGWRYDLPWTPIKYTEEVDRDQFSPPISGHRRAQGFPGLSLRCPAGRVADTIRL